MWLLLTLLLVTLTYVSATNGLDPKQWRDEIGKGLHSKNVLNIGEGSNIAGITGISGVVHGTPTQWMSAISANITKIRGTCVFVPDMKLTTPYYANYTKYLISFSSETKVNSTTGGKIYIFGFVDNKPAFGPAWFADADNGKDYDSKTVQFTSMEMPPGIHIITIQACTTDFKTEGSLWYKNMNVMILE